MADIHDEAHPQEQVHPVPVHPSIQRVLALAIDASGYSEYAFHWTLENILNPETDLVILLHVRSIPAIPGPFGKPFVIPGVLFKSQKERRIWISLNTCLNWNRMYYLLFINSLLMS